VTGLPGVAAAYARDVLEALVDRDSRWEIMLAFVEASELLPEVSGRDVDDALLEARELGLVFGDRGEGDGSVCWWSRVRLTPSALRLLGEWPPAHREWEPGGWDAGYWGQRARPLLAGLRDDPPASDFLFKPIGEGSDEWAGWTAALLLRDAELISGRLTDAGIDTLRLTAAGLQALDPSPREPLDDAIAKLRSGARVDAMVTAVESALGVRLKELAASHGLAITRPDGTPVPLSRLNNDLRTAGAYREADRAQVDAWLKARNDLAHANATVPSDARAEAVITSIRVFLDEHPA
jgi:hypothetical protein